MISAEGLKEIDRAIAKYPADQKQSAVMSALAVAQEEHGWLSPEALREVADRCLLPRRHSAHHQKSRVLLRLQARRTRGSQDFAPEGGPGDARQQTGGGRETLRQLVESLPGAPDAWLRRIDAKE